MKMILLLWMFAVASRPDEDFADRVRQARVEISRNPRNFDPSSLPADLSEPVLHELRELGLRLGNPGPTAALLHIMDPKALAELRQIPLQPIEESGQARLVHQFSEEFLREDGDAVGGPFDTVYPTSVSIGQMVLRLLEHSSEVSPEVRVWSRNNSELWMVKKAGVSRFRDIMRDWWNANEQHFRSEQFSLVKPGRELLPDSDRAQIVESKGPESTAREMSQPSTRLNVGSVAKIDSPASAASPMYIAIAGAALLGAAIISIFVRKKRV
jgi:hypothetical protein